MKERVKRHANLKECLSYFITYLFFRKNCWNNIRWQFHKICNITDLMKLSSISVTLLFTIFRVSLFTGEVNYNITLEWNCFLSRARLDKIAYRQSGLYVNTLFLGKHWAFHVLYKLRKVRCKTPSKSRYMAWKIDVT